MKFFILSLSCWMIIFQQQVIAQTARDMEAQFRKEIEQRGISEEEFQSKLDEGGIDLEQLKELSIQDAANMKGEIEIYDYFIRGDVFGFQVLDEDEEVIDSCYGFYGDDFETNGLIEYVPEEFHEVLKSIEVSY